MFDLKTFKIQGGGQPSVGCPERGSGYLQFCLWVRVRVRVGVSVGV